jgi:hypothetical protein
LERIEATEKPLDRRVERMKRSKNKHSLIYDEFLTLGGIPLEVFEYRLGNRSALDRIIDQYQVSTDKRSGIATGPPTQLSRKMLEHEVSGQMILWPVVTAPGSDTVRQASFRVFWHGSHK